MNDRATSAAGTGGEEVVTAGTGVVTAGTGEEVVTTGTAESDSWDRR